MYRELCAGVTDVPRLFLLHFPGSSFFSPSAPSAKMKQKPLEIRWEMHFPTSCSDACSGRRVKILSKFHGGLAHFLPSNCTTACGTGQELGQLSLRQLPGLTVKYVLTTTKSSTKAIKVYQHCHDALPHFSSSVSAGGGCSSSFRCLL